MLPGVLQDCGCVGGEDVGRWHVVRSRSRAQDELTWLLLGLVVCTEAAVPWLCHTTWAVLSCKVWWCSATATAWLWFMCGTRTGCMEEGCCMACTPSMHAYAFTVQFRACVLGMCLGAVHVAFIRCMHVTQLMASLVGIND